MAFVLLTVWRWRFALVEVGVLKVTQLFWGAAVMGGAAWAGLRVTAFSRAAHRALHINVERHGIRAARRLGSAGRQFNR